MLLRSGERSLPTVAVNQERIPCASGTPLPCTSLRLADITRFLCSSLNGVSEERAQLDDGLDKVLID